LTVDVEHHAVLQIVTCCHVKIPLIVDIYLLL